jgi:hypothetical protein
MSHVVPETSPDYDHTRIVERPTGFYWRSKGAAREYGPFASLVEAVEDMKAMGDAVLEPGETLREAEDEVGIADWIDPETGEPAEESRPHLEDQ